MHLEVVLMRAELISTINFCLADLVVEVILIYPKFCTQTVSRSMSGHISVQDNSAKELSEVIRTCKTTLKLASRSSRQRTRIWVETFTFKLTRQL